MCVFLCCVLLCCVFLCCSVTLLCRWEDADEDSQQTKPQQPRHIPPSLLAMQLAISVCCSSALLQVHVTCCLLAAAAAAAAQCSCCSCCSAALEKGPKNLEMFIILTNLSKTLPPLRVKRTHLTIFLGPFPQALLCLKLLNNLLLTRCSASPTISAHTAESPFYISTARCSGRTSFLK